MISLLSDPMSSQGEVEPADPQMQRGALWSRSTQEDGNAVGWEMSPRSRLIIKKSQLKCYVLEEESREVPQLLKLPCQHLRAVGWLAGSDKN